MEFVPPELGSEFAVIWQPGAMQKRCKIRCCNQPQVFARIRKQYPKYLKIKGLYNPLRPLAIVSKAI
jgi:hypothetical protein